MRHRGTMRRSKRPFSLRHYETKKDKEKKRDNGTKENNSGMNEKNDEIEQAMNDKDEAIEQATSEGTTRWMKRRGSKDEGEVTRT